MSFPDYLGHVRAQPDGQSQHAYNSYTIIVRLRSTNGISVQNYPRQYIVLVGGGQLHDCQVLSGGSGGNSAFVFADANTDANGYTTFTLSTPFYCGGQLNAGQDVTVLINNNSGLGGYWQYIDSGQTLEIRTADFDGDGTVGLSDTAIFAAAMGGPYDARADLNFDGFVNLSDLPLYSAAYGVQCP